MKRSLIAAAVLIGSVFAVPGPSAAEETGPWVDTSDRDAVLAAMDTLRDHVAVQPEPGWTGSDTDCDTWGDVNPEFRTHYVETLNMMRAFAGTEPVTANTDAVAYAQRFAEWKRKLAFGLECESTMGRTPPGSSGWSRASSAGLVQGVVENPHVLPFPRDQIFDKDIDRLTPGFAVTFDPDHDVMPSGYSLAHLERGTGNTTRDSRVSWPPAGYFPSGLWTSHFEYRNLDGHDLTGATVRVFRDGTEIEVSKVETHADRVTFVPHALSSHSSLTLTMAEQRTGYDDEYDTPPRKTSPNPLHREAATGEVFDTESTFRVEITGAGFTDSYEVTVLPTLPVHAPGFTHPDTVDPNDPATWHLVVPFVRNGFRDMSGFPDFRYYHAFSMDELLGAKDYELADHSDILRLYRAFFDREPDFRGARYWIGIHRRGMPLEEIAEWFTAQEEYRNNYDGTTDRQFLEAVYANVLGRDYDQDGFDYWLDLLQGTNNHGGNTKLADLSRGEVVRWVSASTEFTNTYPYRATWCDTNPHDHDCGGDTHYPPLRIAPIHLDKQGTLGDAFPVFEDGIIVRTSHLK